jgi:UDP-N-acetylglucosamine--N-acetylmuramyl-(pentapeptide) pyrophosphoryl-undecaprenol N-acetylglucosamine transferase
MSEGPRCLIAAGGTGGHFYPGLVLAKTLRGRGWSPLLVVKAGDAALRVLETESLPAVELDLSGLPRRPGPELLRFGFKLTAALRQAGRIVRDFRPSVVVGMGGYLTFPLAAAAAWRGLPRAVHESNAVLGLANRACLMLGAKLFSGLPGPKGTLVGTPIRPALWTKADPAAARAELGLNPAKKTLLVFGGSQGARALNERLPLLLKGLDAQILHLHGKSDVPHYAGTSAVILPFLDRMELAYAAADVVVCRSGAGTLAELAAQGKPAVLVPFPQAAEDHQTANARAAEARGAAVIIPEGDLDSRLAAVLGDLLSSESRRRGMSEAWSLLGLPGPAQAAEKLADAVEALV